MSGFDKAAREIGGIGKETQGPPARCTCKFNNDPCTCRRCPTSAKDPSRCETCGKMRAGGRSEAKFEFGGPWNMHGGYTE